MPGPARIEHRIIDGVECKRCSRCKQWEPLDCFHKNKTKWDGLHRECKDCRSQRDKRYWKQNKKKLSQRNKKYRKQNKKKISQRDKQKYENKRNIIKSRWGTVCAITGKELFKKPRDFCLHHVSYDCLQKYPGSPTVWSPKTLQTVERDCFLLLSPMAHDLIHIFLNFQRWKYPCDFDCIIKKLKALYSQGKLNWTHTKRSKKDAIKDAIKRGANEK